MKPLNYIYMTLRDGIISFPKSIRYYEHRYYICEDHSGLIYMVDESMVFKIDSKEFTKFTETVFDAIYNDVPRVATLQSMSDKVYTFDIHPNGHVYTKIWDNLGFFTRYSCTISCPRNMLKLTNVGLESYSDDSYAVKPCNERGEILESHTKDANPYSANCNIVYEFINKHPGISTNKLIDVIGWPANRVTPRLSELVNGGRIESIGREYNKETRRYVTKWGITGAKE